MIFIPASALFGSEQNTKLLYCTFRLVSTTSMINLYPVQKQKSEESKMNVQCHPEGASSRRNMSEELLIRRFQLTEERDKHKNKRQHIWFSASCFLLQADRAAIIPLPAPSIRYGSFPFRKTPSLTGGIPHRCRPPDIWVQKTL